MSRILLVDDSPHAQRMCERILSEEGYEVVAVSNADSALIRLEDVDPDVVLADAVMPGCTGYEICQYIKLSPRHKHVRVILTAGVLEAFDEAHAQRVEADGSLKKPFEASALLAAVKPLAEAAVQARAQTEGGRQAQQGAAGKPSEPSVPFVAVVDAEQVRAAVTVALDASMDAMAEEITRRVLAALKSAKPERGGAVVYAAGQAADLTGGPRQAGPAVPAPPKPALPPPAVPRNETERRVNSLRFRSGSILGLEIGSPEPGSEAGPPEPPSPAPGSK